MNALRPDDFGRAAQMPPPPPQVFVRAITTQPGFPWDQRAAADLDARMGAPAPIGELDYRLVRLHPWVFGSIGRFAALYVRSRDVTEGFVAEAMIERRTVTAVFSTPEVRAAAARRRLLQVGLAATATVIVGSALLSALGARSDREDRLQALEQRGALIAHRTTALLEQKAQARMIEASGLQGHRLSDAAADLDWAANAKAPSAHVQSVHWEGGLMTVTTRGDAAPFANPDREVRRSDRPVGQAQWLWGVGPAPRDQAIGRP